MMSALRYLNNEVEREVTSYQFCLQILPHLCMRWSYLRWYAATFAHSPLLLWCNSKNCPIYRNAWDPFYIRILNTYPKILFKDAASFSQHLHSLIDQWYFLWSLRPTAHVSHKVHIRSESPKDAPQIFESDLGHVGCRCHWNVFLGWRFNEWGWDAIGVPPELDWLRHKETNNQCRVSFGLSFQDTQRWIGFRGVRARRRNSRCPPRRSCN